MKYNLSFLNHKSQTKIKEVIKDSFFLKAELCVRTYENATIFVTKKKYYEGGVIDSSGLIVSNSRFTEMDEDKQAIQLESVKYKNKRAIYIGMFMNCFGHVITDDLKKIWFLKTDYCKQLLLEGADIVCLSRYGLEFKPYVKHILELAGVDWDKTKLIKENVCYKEVIIPDNSFVTTKGIFIKRVYSLQFVNTVNEIKKRIGIKETNSQLKIYLSRTALNDWRERGEQKVEKIFKDAGYKIIHPEKISFEEQIILYNESSEIATTEGSVSHALMFCKPGTKVVILRKGNFINGYQLMINEMNNLDVVYIDANKTIENNVSWYGPFYICPTKELCNYLHVTYSHQKIIDIDFYRYLMLFVKRHTNNGIKQLLYKLKNQWFHKIVITK